MICVASTMVSIFNVPGARLFFFSMISNKRTKVITCSGIVTLGNITTKLSGSFPFVFSNNVVKKNIQCSYAPIFKIFCKWFYAYTDKRRDGFIFHSFRQFISSFNGCCIFFLIGTIAKAIFKINAKIFYCFCF